MLKDLRITDSEWKVMKVIWAKAPIMISEIMIQLKSEGVKWGRTTVQTLVARLIQKEVVGADKSSTTFKYFPLVSEDECIKSETRSFLEKVFDGSASMLVSSFIKNRQLSESEIQKLRDMLDKGNGDRL